MSSFAKNKLEISAKVEKMPTHKVETGFRGQTCNDIVCDGTEIARSNISFWLIPLKESIFVFLFQVQYVVLTNMCFIFNYM